MLHLTIVKGNIMRDTEEFSKMDPFIVVTYNGEKFKTNTCNEGGMTPIWNHLLKIPIIDPKKDSIHIECLEEDITTDDYIGSADVPIKQIWNQTGVKGKGSDVIELYHENEVSAEITIESKVVPMQQSSTMNDSFGAGSFGTLKTK